MAMPPTGVPSVGDSPLHCADHHRVTQELLARQLRKAQERVTAEIHHALLQLSAQHDDALALLADRYNVSASFMPSSFVAHPPTASHMPSDVAVIPEHDVVQKPVMPEYSVHKPVRPPPQECSPERPLTRELPGIVVEEVFDFAAEMDRPEMRPPPVGLHLERSGSNAESLRGLTQVCSIGSDNSEVYSLEGPHDLVSQQGEDTSSGLDPHRPAWSNSPKPVVKKATTVGGGRVKPTNGLMSKSAASSGYDHSRLLEVWMVKDGEELIGSDPRALFKTEAKKQLLGKSPTLQSGIGESNQPQPWEPPDGSKDVYSSNTFLGRRVIHPYHPGRSCWDIGSLLLVLYDMIMIPFNFFEPEDSPGMVFMEWLTRLFWSFDMPLSFFSGFVTYQGSIELRPGKIVKKYMRSWFMLDAMVVGVDWFEVLMSAAAEGLGFARFGKASRVFRILRMLRLLRLARMTEVLNLLTERLDSEKLVIMIDVVKLVIIMLGSGHMIACLFYAIGNATDSDLSWLPQHNYKEDPQVSYKNAPLEFRYIMSLRWAISQFAGGMDEVTPVSFAENVYAVFVYLGAFWSGAVFVSILTSSMTQWYIIGSQQSQQLTVLRRYLSQNGISKKLALRVQRNAKHSLDEQQREMPEHAVSLINSVSEPLRVELHFEMYSNIITVHPFFARYCEECPHVVRKICHTAMQVSQVSTGDTIFNNGEKPDNPHMRIISRGRLKYQFNKKEHVKVNPETCISEPHLWVDWSHKGELVAMEDCRIHLICAKEFQMIVSQFEHVGFEPRAYARLYVECLNAIPEDELSDLPNEDMMHNFKLLLNTRALSTDNLDDVLSESATQRFTMGIPGRVTVMARANSNGSHSMSETGTHIRQAFLNHIKRESTHRDSMQSATSTVKAMNTISSSQGQHASERTKRHTQNTQMTPGREISEQSTESRSFLQPIVCN